MHPLAFFQQQALGYFQLEHARVDLIPFEQPIDDQEKIGMLQLARGKIDRGDDRRPAARILKRALHHPRAQLADLPVALGNGNKHHRGDHPLGGVVPAYQRFEAADGAFRGVAQRLIVQLKLAVRDGVAQIHLASASRKQSVNDARVARISAVRCASFI